MHFYEQLSSVIFVATVVSVFPCHLLDKAYSANRENLDKNVTRQPVRKQTFWRPLLVAELGQDLPSHRSKQLPIRSPRRPAIASS